MLNRHNLPQQNGTSLVEVMVTLAILSFSLLGIAALQSKIGTAEMESYQRAQALVALSQMTERMSANIANAPAYVTGPGNPVGTGDAQPANCAGAGLTGAALDLCEWSNTLKGAGETAGAANVGAMMSGRGCVEQVQPAVFTLGNCQVGIYRVSVVWQGMAPTAAPNANVTCGAGLYGLNDANRRLISATVSWPTTTCY
jgi:type IV pilus assembly protein PilV